MITSIDDLPVTETDQEIPAVPTLAKAITSADEEGILAKMMQAPNAPDPASDPVSEPKASPDRGAQPRMRVYVPCTGQQISRFRAAVDAGMKDAHYASEYEVDAFLASK